MPSSMRRYIGKSSRVLRRVHRESLRPRGHGEEDGPGQEWNERDEEVRQWLAKIGDDPGLPQQPDEQQPGECRDAGRGGPE